MRSQFIYHFFLCCSLLSQYILIILAKAGYINITSWHSYLNWRFLFGVYVFGMLTGYLVFDYLYNLKPIQLKVKLHCRLTPMLLAGPFDITQAFKSIIISFQYKLLSYISNALETNVEKMKIKKWISWVNMLRKLLKDSVHIHRKLRTAFLTIFT